MIRNYLTVAVRNLKRHRIYSVVNVVGLAIGLASCILILLWVFDELSYDRFHENTDRIYRLCVDANIGSPLRAPVCSTPAAPLLVEEYPEVVDAVRIDRPRRLSVQYGDLELFMDRVAYADNSLFSVFTFPLVEGDPRTALKEPYTVVITEERAEKIFGTRDPIGETLRIDGNDEYRVTGVTENVPKNSHFRFDMVCSMATNYARNRTVMEQWIPFHFFTYLLLEEGVEPADLEEKFPALVDEHLSFMLEPINGTLKFFLQPITDIHLYSTLDIEMSHGGNIKLIYLFSAIALFILAMACFNFINLTTARSASRAMEVGMRKTFGAHRTGLVKQFISETSFYSLVALTLALVIVEIASPVFGSISGTGLSTNYLEKFWFIPGCVGFALVVGHLAGTYPAYYLSSFQPVKVLHGTLSGGASRSRFRGILVVGQFVITVALVIGTVTIYHQIHYMRNMDLGFDRENLIVLPNVVAPDYATLAAIREEFTRVPGVVQVSVSDRVPGFGTSKGIFTPEGYGGDESQTLSIINADPEFLETMGIELVAGRNFSYHIETDTTVAVIINETAARKFGWNNPVGKTFMPRSEIDTTLTTKVRRVIGVVRDFNFSPLRYEIEPLLVFFERKLQFPENYRMMVIRLAPDDMDRTIELLSGKWDTLKPGRPFDYFTMDKVFAYSYMGEQRLGRIALSFSILAIFIGCLGLFGMAAYSAEQRTKEIGIRKALGASVGSIVRLLTMEFFLLVLVANLIAWPVVYYAMNRWLEDFAYRVDIDWRIFVLTGVFSLLISLVTVSFQAVKAARANPVDALRYE